MISNALKTLLHPFEAGLLSMPAAGASVLFLGARPGFRVPEGFDAELALVQGFRPDVLALQREGFATSPELQGESCDLALVLAGRHRGENELRLAEAIARVKPDGLIVMAGDKTDGVASLRQRLEKNEDRMAAAKNFFITSSFRFKASRVLLLCVAICRDAQSSAIDNCTFASALIAFDARTALAPLSKYAAFCATIVKGCELACPHTG